MYELLQNKKNIEQEIRLLQQDLGSIHTEIEFFKTSFAKEKISREVLMMKKEDEIVYFIE